MLTTSGAQEIKDKVVTDINANVMLPEGHGKVLSREAALLFNKSVVARPLMVPEVCSVHVKNTEYMYRWVNNGSMRGQMYMKRRFQGFVNATTDDVDVLGGDVVSDNGTITAGDLILMKIRGDLYDAHIKSNMEQALRLQRTRGMYFKGASSDVMSDSVATRHTVVSDLPERARAKAVPFIPDNPDSLVEASTHNGGLEAAREQTDEIREKIKADRKAKKDAVTEE